MNNIWLDLNLREDDLNLIKALNNNKCFNPVLFTSIASKESSKDIKEKIEKEVKDVKVIAGSNHPISSINFYNHELDKNDMSNIVDEIYEYIKDKNNIDVVLTGGATNLAYVINRYPEIHNNIDKVIFVGGAYAYGTITPTAENNAYFDPEALKILLDNKLPIYFIPEELRINNNHTILSLLVLLEEDIFEFTKYKTGIEILADYTRGMTVIYRNGLDHFDYIEKDNGDVDSIYIKVKEEDKNSYYPEIKNKELLIPLIDKLMKGEY